MTTWLPQEYAELDKYLELKNDDDQWENGWQVVDIYDPPMEEAQLMERSQDYKRTRKASDI